MPLVNNAEIFEFLAADMKQWYDSAQRSIKGALEGATGNEGQLLYTERVCELAAKVAIDVSVPHIVRRAQEALLEEFATEKPETAVGWITFTDKDGTSDTLSFENFMRQFRISMRNPPNDLLAKQMGTT